MMEIFFFFFFFFFNLSVDVLHWATLFLARLPIFVSRDTFVANSPASKPTAQAGLGLVDSMKQDKNRLSCAADCRLAESKLTI